MHIEIETSLSQELFNSINQHLMNDQVPSEYLNQVSQQPEFKIHPFQMLLELKETEQSKEHHPEGNVWIHTLLVVDQAAKRRHQSKNPTVFMWAALLHDIGKPATTKTRKGKITSYNHETVGAELANKFLSALTEDTEFTESVCSLIKYHMQILFVTKDLQFADIKGMEQESDISEIALLGLCDRLGRKGASKVEEEENIKLFLKKCKYYLERNYYKNGKSRNEKTRS